MCSRVSVDLSLHYLAESTKEQLAISRFVDSNEAVAETRTCLLYNCAEFIPDEQINDMR